jgi:SAM-dependent methyltransferase
MAGMDATGPNAEQITYWNEKSGPKWVAHQAALDSMIAPFGAEAMAALGPREGERLIDVGCGCGATSIELGRRVGAGGGVLGVDISEPMLARARERAAAEGIGHVRFVVADAQTHPFEPGGAHGVFSRFGVMFFADPPSAFANLARALRPDGRVAFVCWQPVTENPWMLTPLMAVAGIVPLPPPPPPDAPGPFAFGDRDRVRRILGDAGFRRVEMTSFAPEVVIAGGADLDRSVAFLLQLGPLGALLGDATPDVQARVAGAVRDAITPFHSARGVAMPSAAWIVSARR